MNNKRTIAKLTGWSLIFMAIVAAFVFGFVNPKIYTPNDTELLQSNLMQNMQLYNYMLAGFVIIILLDLIVSWTIFLFFKEDNRKLAMLSFLLRIIYTIIFTISFTYLLNNSLLTVLNNDAILKNYNKFYHLWSIALIVFGFHLLVVGILMKLHKRIHKIIWILTIIAAISYVIVHFLKVAIPSLDDFTKTLEAILALPMTVGEMGLAIWLIVRGGKLDKT